MLSDNCIRVHGCATARNRMKMLRKSAGVHLPASVLVSYRLSSSFCLLLCAFASLYCYLKHLRISGKIFLHRFLQMILPSMILRFLCAFPPLRLCV